MLPQNDAGPQNSQQFKYNDLLAINQLVDNFRQFAKDQLMSRTFADLVQDEDFEYRLMKREKQSLSTELMNKINIIDAELTMYLTEYRLKIISAQNNFVNLSDDCNIEVTVMANDAILTSINSIKEASHWATLLGLDFDNHRGELERMLTVSKNSVEAFEKKNRDYLDAYKIKLPFVYQELELGEVLRQFIKDVFDSRLDFEALEAKLCELKKDFDECRSNMEVSAGVYTNFSYLDEIQRSFTLAKFVIYFFSIS